MLQTKTNIAGCLIVADEFLEEFGRSIQQPAATSKEESFGAMMKIERVWEAVGRSPTPSIVNAGAELQTPHESIHQGASMYTKTITAFYVCILILIAISAAAAQAPARKSEAVVTYDDVRAGTCDSIISSVGMVTPKTANDTVLFNRTYRGQPSPQFCQPLLNPDGSQMTLGQYADISGRAAVKCIRRGSHSVMQFSGLRPNGVYSIWIVLFGSAPGPPIGVGGIGSNEPYENGFTADADGVGQIGRITPEQDLSIFGHVGPCMLDSPLVLEVVYHGDGLLHGGDPGPGYTWVTNAAFIYR